MVLQVLKNEFVNFGGYVDLQVSNEIYNQKYQRRPKFCTICLAFKRGYFEVVWDSTQPLMFKD
jgi:hypothetical protein